MINIKYVAQGLAHTKGSVKLRPLNVAVTILAGEGWNHRKCWWEVDGES